MPSGRDDVDWWPDQDLTSAEREARMLGHSVKASVGPEDRRTVVGRRDHRSTAPGSVELSYGKRGFRVPSQ